MSTITKERLFENVNIAEKRVFEGGICDYIKIMARFPGFDFRNQLLIWRQCPDAKCVAGAEAFKVLERRLAKDAKPIILLYPKFDFVKNGEEIEKRNVSGEVKGIPEEYPAFSFDYVPVCGYDISDTDGEQIEEICHKKLIETLKKFDIEVMSVPESDLGPDGRYKDGILSDRINKKTVFVVDMKLDGRMKKNRIISLFCKFVTDEDGACSLFDENTEKLARELVIATVQYYFGDSSVITDSSLPERFKELVDLSDKQKDAFIRRISKDSSDAIKMLDGHFISFNEMAIVNAFFRINPVITDPATFVDNILRPILYEAAGKDTDIRTDIDSFADVLKQSDAGMIKKLSEKVKKQEAFSYPFIYYT